jgi:hypothetical protein
VQRWLHFRAVALLISYDPRLEENVSYFAELERFAQDNDLEKHVTFIRSFRSAGMLEPGGRPPYDA